jgi:hypothetical protein
MWKWLNNERTLAYLSLTAVVVWAFVFGLQVRNFYVQRQRDIERSQKLDELNAALQSIVDEITKKDQ